MPNPTAGGLLSITAAALRADPQDVYQNGLNRAGDTDGFAICMVVALRSHRFDGPLLGLGTGPIPWA